ncbi:putative SprT-like protein [Mycobacterium phage Pukovnik]|uniref:SprT-like protein n=1 Tax=Mycobacterium phage Pukovnik TaxID=2914013 RepID=B3VGM8_9CAUD|nr:putative SprT-like protein [Mycobacterium phage Pukovnik]ACE80005.1 putative SprT-like protein [Mycobacterium phage Pukovnik]
MTAMMTRQMTMTEARRIAQDLLTEHGLAAFGWTVRFDNARKRAGQCNYRLQVISLSKPLMARRSYEDTKNTITHEIAHALTPGHHHDYVWARKHRELGGDGKRCFEMEGIDPTAPWVGTCARGKQYARYRAPKRLDGWQCKCGGLRHSLTWEKRR